MLEFQNVSFSYGKKEVLRELSFSLNEGEILSVMGPSGSGKTTLLTLAAGLKKPRGGAIVNTFQRTAYVFQEPRLFPWLTVAQNLEAVLQAPKEQRGRISDVLETVGLSGTEELFPSELSGGMKSRVSLARALLFDADLYLFDEPFSALDEELKIDGDLPEYVRKVLIPMNRADGDNIPVSTFTQYADGVMPISMARFEKRGVADNVPVWDADKCIGCNRCSLVCPHGAIRPFLFTEEEAAAAPESAV